jgi:hypothetical protein
LPLPIGSFFAYNAGFTGGVYVASADFNGDGFADVLTGADAGGGPHVRVFSGLDGTELVGFFDVPKEGRGVRVATGDINGDGTPDIITSPGPGDPLFQATVRVFSGLTAMPIAGPLASFDPYPGFPGGVYVAAGDVNNDGRDDVITGAGAGGGPHVKALSGMTGGEIASFFAYNGTFTGGVRVGVGDVNRDGLFDLITGPGPGGGPHVRAFSLPSGVDIANFFAYNAAFAGGVFVAGSAGVSSALLPPGAPTAALLGPSAPQQSSAPSDSTSDEAIVPVSTGKNTGAELVFSSDEATEEDWLSPDDDEAEVAADTFWEEMADLVHGIGDVL